jgi:1,4-alpha-glucan branching enzyme
MAKPTQEKASTKKAKTTAKKTTTKRSTSKEPTVSNAGIKKEYLKRKNVCKVTFRLPRIAVPEAKTVCVVGEFNNWNIYGNTMKKLKSGDFTLTLDLEPGREYQFRYLIDESRWENDWNADKYVTSPYGDSDNSVIVL